MELTSPRTNTLKINSKKGYILVDPDISEEAKIIILSDNSTQEISQTDDNLVIYGPGDFESSGILIKGNRTDAGTNYEIDTGEGRVLLTSSNSIAKLTDEEDFDAVAVHAVTPVEEATLSAISSRLVIVYGEEANIPDSLKAKKVNKVNLKKTEEIEGNVVYLEKK